MSARILTLRLPEMLQVELWLCTGGHCLLGSVIAMVLLVAMNRYIDRSVDRLHRIV